MTAEFRRDPILWHCPACAVATWPGVDRYGRVIARMCVGCQIAFDDATEQGVAVRPGTDEVAS